MKNRRRQPESAERPHRRRRFVDWWNRLKMSHVVVGVVLLLLASLLLEWLNGGMHILQFLSDLTAGIAVSVLFAKFGTEVQGVAQSVERLTTEVTSLVTAPTTQPDGPEPILRFPH